MDFLMVAILGLVQGITEFLPISSSGHLILVREIFGTQQSAQDLAFDAVLHLATTGAILLYFSKDIWQLLQTVFRFLGRLPVDQRDKTLISALLVGTIPAVILGFLLEDIMEEKFRNPLLVAGTLVFGSLIFAFAEYIYTYKNRQASLTPLTGFKIGLLQCLALIPGMSRSGMTISGGLMFGLTRYEAARFAFLLAIPVMIGAGAKKALELLTSSAQVDWVFVGVGAVVSFLVGLGAIHFMMNFISKYSLWPFIWYRIVLAIFVVALVFSN